ncbi:MAG: hypothetical protein LKK19_02540 [Bacteroidales bacterium]|jgi:hypothetical protein|nr:hypothetical protein [Bacteroidales bacterium]MCI2121563.1 hypothetical protein [Bacteroidales bacterium]MCI2145076.1 hypothetical protein [Bacteroidales bacterium]
MGMISFFDTPEHKVFTYKPRFYDPDKEKIKQAYAKKRLKAEKQGEALPETGKDEYKPGEYIHGAYDSPKFEQKTSHVSNKGIRSIAWICSLILAFLIVYIIFDKFVPYLTK